MALPKHGPRVFAAVAAAALVMSPMAHADDVREQPVSYQQTQCAPLYETSTGRPIAAVISADMYSTENVGSVGIPIAPGRDLGNRSPHELGAMLVEGLRRTGVEAQCFIDNEPAPNGTGIDFIINGIGWRDRDSLSISEALNVETIRAVSDEAKTARRLLASNQEYSTLNQ